MDDFSLKVFHSLEGGNNRFGSESTAYHNFVKVFGFFAACTLQANLPLGTFRVPLDPLDRGVEFHISVEIEVSGVGLKVVTYLRSREVRRKVYVLPFISHHNPPKDYGRHTIGYWEVCERVLEIVRHKSIFKTSFRGHLR
jgi:hypothetical protein